MSINITQQIFNIFFIGRCIQENKSTKNFLTKTIYNYICCIGRDGTRFDIQCAFIYSDIMVNISQVTPVTIQNKNHLEIIQIITFK